MPTIEDILPIHGLLMNKKYHHLIHTITFHKLFLLYGVFSGLSLWTSV